MLLAALGCTDTLAERMAAARGDCTATALVAVDDEPLSRDLYTFDTNGDERRVESTHEDEEDDWIRETEYAGPQRKSVEHLWYPYQEIHTDDRLATFEWRAGHLVAERLDLGVDDTIDWDGQHVWEHDQLVRSAWDADGDGYPEDQADFSWSPCADGWSVAGEGWAIEEGVEGARDAYTTEEWWDEALRRTRYTLRDSSGWELAWEVSGWSALGLPDDSWRTSTWDGRTWREDVVVELDELGRAIRVETTAGFEDDAIPAVETVSLTYSCP